MIMRVHYKMLSQSKSGVMLPTYWLYSVSSGYFSCRCGRSRRLFSSTRELECSFTKTLQARSRELMAAL